MKISVLGIPLLLALLLGAPMAEAAPAPPAASAFVRQAFGYYRNEEFTLLGKGAPLVFDPALVALLREEQRLTPDGEMGALDADPLCQCQDPAGARVRILGTTSTGKTTANVRIAVLFGPDEGGRANLKLALVKGRWRIHDIQEENMPSLRAYLQRAIANWKAGRPVH